MPLNLVPSTSLDRKNLFIETLLNQSDLISKVSPNSVFSGLAGGVSKIAGKAEKDIVLSLSALYIDSASGSQLDQAAIIYGISPRLGASGSSTYVRVQGTPGTTVIALTNLVQSNSGIIFQFSADFTIPSWGYCYQSCSSQTQGSVTNIPPLTATSLSPNVSGVNFVVNEVQAQGGRDAEDDNTFRTRIKLGPNQLATSTLECLTQVFINQNPKVLKVFSNGLSNTGQTILAIITQDASQLNSTELSQLLTAAQDYFSLTDISPFGTKFTGVTLVNAILQPFSSSFRVSIDPSVNSDTFRINVQTAWSKLLDFRTFNSSTTLVQWTTLFEIVQNTPGCLYLPNAYWFPKTDLTISNQSLPILQGFLMLDLTGNIISNFSGSLNPVYYNNQILVPTAATVLGLTV
jgi:hypothetical protein